MSSFFLVRVKHTQTKLSLRCQIFKLNAISAIEKIDAQKEALSARKREKYLYILMPCGFGFLPQYGQFSLNN
ncbi:hypothetical protein CGK40_22650 [Vibrio parahaemolyticus]|nr:hypothetical protein CGK40_22650 [Vibrio parahaemolyticus]